MKYGITSTDTYKFTNELTKVNDLSIPKMWEINKEASTE